MRSGNRKRLPEWQPLVFTDVREELVDRTPSDYLTGEFADCYDLWLLNASFMIFESVTFAGAPVSSRAELGESGRCFSCDSLSSDFWRP